MIREKVNMGGERKLNISNNKYKQLIKFFINYFFTIRMKLILSVMVPIFFIIFLGIMSFQKAAEGIRSSYENFTEQTINMSGEYLSIGLETVKNIGAEYINNREMEKYLLGLYNNDNLKYSAEYKKIQESIIAKESVDNFISSISILTDQVQSVTTVNKSFTDACDNFYNTELGQYMKQNPLKITWLGDNEYFDKIIGDNYAIRSIRFSQLTKAIIVIDIGNDIVNEVLSKLELDGIGIVGLVTPDGREIISGQEEGTSSLEFTDQLFYQEAVKGDKLSSSEYVMVGNEEYLFIYDKLSDSGIVICALIPKSIILSKANSIKQLTCIIVIIACIIAAFIGIMISLGIDKEINKIIKDLKRQLMVI